MPTCIELMPCDWPIRDLHTQEQLKTGVPIEMASNNSFITSVSANFLINLGGNIVVMVSCPWFPMGFLCGSASHLALPTRLHPIAEHTRFLKVHLTSAQFG